MSQQPEVKNRQQDCPALDGQHRGRETIQAYSKNICTCTVFQCEAEIYVYVCIYTYLDVY